MKTYIQPLGEPTRSAVGPSARRGSRTSMHSAERVTQFADSSLCGMRSSTGDGATLAAALAARLAASVAATPAPGVTPPTMRVGTALASAADCGEIGAPPLAEPAAPRAPNTPCGALGGVPPAIGNDVGSAPRASIGSRSTRYGYSLSRTQASE